MDLAKHSIAIFHCADDYSEPQQVEDLSKGLVFSFHLIVDTVKMLGPPLYIRFNAASPQGFIECHHDSIKITFALAALLGHHVYQTVILRRIKVAKREIFQFPFNFPHSQSMCQGCVDIKGFLRDSPLAILGQIFQRVHIVHAIRQLNQDDAEVFGHRQKHLAQILCLPLFTCLKINFTELCDPINQHGDLGTELGLYFGNQDIRIFNHIMQDRGAQSGQVHFHLS